MDEWSDVMGVSEDAVSMRLAVVTLARLAVGYMILLLLLVSSLIRVRLGGVLRSSFRPPHITDGGLPSSGPVPWPSDKSSDSREPASQTNINTFSHDSL